MARETGGKTYGVDEV